MSKHIAVHAADISCKHCAMTITRELSALEGISNVQVDVSTRMVEFDLSDEATTERALATLADIGYPATQA
jgi:copper chaperone CopZ